MQRPSKKWKSHQLAVLESVEHWLQKRLTNCSIVHAGALGFFAQYWLSQYLGSPFTMATGHDFLVVSSIVLLVFTGLVGLVFAYFIFELRNRMKR
ncbi:hypothetical protein FHS72_002528 [Loktanella ponticola]|uniref:Uncharacterized protein n=1 Tax=Yoonia ponticola TaxID=1524255 RepID=A0A7W9BLT3_9RHOB|nr:hypothetical protein [Yoonia ponticola]